MHILLRSSASRTVLIVGLLSVVTSGCASDSGATRTGDDSESAPQSTTSAADHDGAKPSLDPEHDVTPSGEGSPEGQSGHGIGSSSTLPPENGAIIAGVVRETMNSGGYTYLHVQLESDEWRWAAVAEAPIAVGDHVVLKISIKMTDFRSNSLERTFAAIWFATLETREPAGGASPDSDTI